MTPFCRTFAPPIRRALVLAAAFAFSTGVVAGEQPNILFILVDDQSPFDLKVYNPKSPLQTPTLDRLGGGGHGVRRRLSHGLVRRGRSARRRAT